MNEKRIGGIHQNNIWSAKRAGSDMTSLDRSQHPPLWQTYRNVDMVTKQKNEIISKEQEKLAFCNDLKSVKGKISFPYTSLVPEDVLGGTGGTELKVRRLIQVSKICVCSCSVEWLWRGTRRLSKRTTTGGCRATILMLSSCISSKSSRMRRRWWYIRNQREKQY